MYLVLSSAQCLLGRCQFIDSSFLLIFGNGEILLQNYILPLKLLVGQQRVSVMLDTFHLKLMDLQVGAG